MRMLLINAVIRAFVGHYYRESVFATILNLQIISEFIKLPLMHILFGCWGEIKAVSTELRLLYYTFRFGIIWLFLFLAIFLIGFGYAMKIVKSPHASSFDRKFSMGTLALLCVCFLDMGHYARVMTWPAFDIMALCLGVLSAIIATHKQRIKELKNIC
ncbi:MAG: hypothetical protein ABIA63_12340, partial [bacterium]